MADDSSQAGWSLGRPGQRAPRIGRRAGSGRFLVVILTLLLAAGMVGGGLWNAFRSDSFPKLPPGRYVGTLSGATEFGVARDWILTIPEDFKHLQALFLGPDGAAFPAQRNGSGYLVVSAGDHEVIFRGAAPENGGLKGTFQYGDSRRSGDWTLAPAELTTFEADQSFRNWMVLRSEISRVARDIEIAQRLIPSQKIEIEDLSKTITDESAVKELGQRRIKELDARLAQVQAELLKVRKDVEQGESQLRLAQKVSARGKLVSLSRESLERESRWARSLLVGSLGAMSSDLEDALKRAGEIQLLKEALANERRSIEELSAQLGADRL